MLHGLEFSIAEGQIVGVLGHNGMGKTTLLKSLMGLTPATSGEIIFDGIDVTRLPTHERSRLGIGYVPQGRGIFPILSVRDNLRMGLAAHGAGNEEEAQAGILEEFPQLARLLDRQGGALSGGEQQLLALARCLISDPQIVLLDEPTEGIQPSIVDLIEEKLSELRSKRGLSILLIEQNLEFITGLSDRVLILQKGQIAGEIEKGGAPFLLQNAGEGALALDVKARPTTARECAGYVTKRPIRKSDWLRGAASHRGQSVHRIKSPRQRRGLCSQSERLEGARQFEWALGIRRGEAGARSVYDDRP